MAAKRGRPTSYKPEYAEQARKLCLLGATDDQLADFFDVSINTIANWQRVNPEFLGALKGGKEEADDRVERSLFQRAVGYTFDSVKIMSYEGAVIEAPFREHCPPDVTAQIFWLKNRRSAEWRDKRDMEHSGPNGGPIQQVISDKPVSQEEWEARHCVK